MPSDTHDVLNENKMETLTSDVRLNITQKVAGSYIAKTAFIDKSSCFLNLS